MAKTNYSYEKRQQELKKQKKRQEKLKKKQEKKVQKDVGSPDYDESMIENSENLENPEAQVADQDNTDI